MDENSRLVQVKKGVYDATPALVNEFTVDYQYDEMGRMLRRDDGTDVTDYFYDGWDIWKEVTGESVTEYLVPSLSVQSFLRDGELFTLHSDGISSVRVVTDSEGDVAARIELGAWGETLPGSVDLVPGGLTADFVGALGVRRDTLTGLILTRNRWYTPTFGCFVSRDPISLRGGPNLYTYVENNPTNLVDPSGLEGLGSAVAGVGRRLFQFGTGLAKDAVQFGSKVPIRPAPTVPAAIPVAVITLSMANTNPHFGSDPASDKFDAYRDRQQSQDCPDKNRRRSKEKLALGLSNRLDPFAKEMGAKTWKDFPDPGNWWPTMVQKVTDPSVEKLFLLEGVNVWPGLSRAARGAGGPTDCELMLIRNTPGSEFHVQFYLGTPGNYVPTGRPF